MRPAGEGITDEQAVVANTVFTIHSHTGVELEAGRRELLIMPFTAGVMEFVSGPYGADRMEGICLDRMRGDVA